MDLNGFEWYMYNVHVVQLATNTVQIVSPCVYKTNFEILNGLKMVYQSEG